MGTVLGTASSLNYEIVNDVRKKAQGSDACGVKKYVINGQKAYHFNVKFRGHNTTAFSKDRVEGVLIQAKSFKAAMMLVEAYAQQMQFQTIATKADYVKIRNEFRSRSFSVAVNTSRDPAKNEKTATAVFFQSNFFKNGLEHTFGPLPGRTNVYGQHSHVTISHAQLTSIKKAADLRKIAKGKGAAAPKAKKPGVKATPPKVTRIKATAVVPPPGRLEVPRRLEVSLEEVPTDDPSSESEEELADKHTRKITPEPREIPLELGIGSSSDESLITSNEGFSGRES